MNANLEDDLRQLHSQFDRDYALPREQLLNQILASTPEARPRAWYYSRPMKAIASLAACLGFLAAGWAIFGGNGASRAFADAMAQLQKARTFSCHQIVEWTDDGQKRASEWRVMFKEPNLERLERLAGGPGTGEITVSDYGTRRRLNLDSAKKTAMVQDLSSSYQVIRSSGALELTRLDTRVRDQVLSITAEAVQDLGPAHLDGRPVRVLRSQKGDRITTVWVEPQGHVPVQITIEQPGRRFVYASIQIDTELDESLFSVEVPAGYTQPFAEALKVATRSAGSAPAQRAIAEDKYKLMPKIKHAGQLCHEYRGSHNDQFPQALSDLVGPELSAEVLTTLLAAPDQPNGPAVITYRRPRDGAEPSKEVMLYETDTTQERFVVGYADGHCELVTKEKFEQLMR